MSKGDTLHKVKLTKFHNTEEIYMNPNNILYIEPFEGGSIITFSKQHWYSVQETPEEIYKIMKNSERIY